MSVAHACDGELRVLTANLPEGATAPGPPGSPGARVRVNAAMTDDDRGVTIRVHTAGGALVAELTVAGHASVCGPFCTRFMKKLEGALALWDGRP